MVTPLDTASPGAVTVAVTPEGITREVKPPVGMFVGVRLKLPPLATPVPGPVPVTVKECELT